MTELYNCADLDELFACRKDSRGTELVTLDELTFATPNGNADMLEYNGFSVYLLAIDNGIAEVFIP